jgi:hypothetical protein
MPPALLRLLSLLLVLGVAACPRPTPTTDASTEPAPHEKPPVAKRAPTPAADPTHPLELVPARARAMIMARSPQRLAEIWGRERFVGRFPAQYERLVADLRRDLGHDLLDPGALAGIGVDPTAPVGAAVLSFHDEVFMVFGGSSDPKAMIALLERVAGKPLPPQTVGEAQLVRVDEEFSLVLRHGMFALVLVDRHRQGAPDYAMEVARIDPAQSLAHGDTMERAHAGLPHETDLHALLDVAGILRDDMERSQRDDQEMLGDANRRLAEARQRGASADEINGLQQSVQQQQEFQARRRRERQVSELLLSRTFGAIAGIGLAVDSSDRGLRGRIHFALDDDAAFRTLLLPSERPPAALAALGDAPHLVVSAQVDVGLAIELFAQAALAAGGSYTAVNDEVRDDLRLDFDRDLRPLLDGRGTFVLTAAPSLDAKRGQSVDRALGGLLAIGVNDEAKARAVLDAVVSKWPEQRFTAAPEIGGWSLTRTEWPQTVYMGVIAGQLVIGDDLATLRRLRDGQAGPASAALPDPEPWQRLTEGGGEARLALHHRLPVMLMFSMLGAFESFDFPRNPDDMLHSEFPEHDVFSIPRSAATQRLEKERDRVFEAKTEVRQRGRKQREVMAWNEAAALGITAGIVRETETGLMIEGGHYVTGGIAGYVEAILALGEVGERNKDADPELARATKRVEQADARLLKARRKEVQRAITKRKPDPMAPIP